MKKITRGVVLVGALAMMGATLGGCSYAGVAAVGGDRVVIPRNDGLLFGVLRKVYVCKVTDSGLSDCIEGEAP